jgi:hypothetical protein
LASRATGHGRRSPALGRRGGRFDFVGGSPGKGGGEKEPRPAEPSGVKGNRFWQTPLGYSLSMKIV